VFEYHWYLSDTFFTPPININRQVICQKVMCENNCVTIVKVAMPQLSHFTGCASNEKDFCVID